MFLCTRQRKLWRKWGARNFSCACTLFKTDYDLCH